MKNMIETKNLTKTYKEFIAVDHVSLHIKKGSIYGFLGPNGAGKSTTMKMLLGLTAPTDGEFQIDNMTFPNDRVQILKNVGSFIESPSFYPNLTGRENLDIIRRILGLPATSVDEALELVGLSEFGNRLAKKYSLGMKQRLGLASALLGEPPVLILDEPTNGLDPAGIHEIRNLIKSLPKRYDCTVLISSHMLSEIELLADDIGILNHGKLLFEGSLDDLKLTAHQAGFENDNLEEMFLATKIMNVTETIPVFYLLTWTVPFITLLVSLFTTEITGGLQTGLIALNVISILSGFVLSVSLVKNPKRRDVFSIVALCVCAFWGLLMVGILTFGLISTFM